MAQPRHADPVPYGVVGNALAQGGYQAHNHVTRRDVLTVHRQVALADVQVCAADAAGQDLDQEFAGTWRRYRFLHVPQRAGLDRSRLGSPPTPASFSRLLTVIPHSYHRWSRRALGIGR